MTGKKTEKKIEKKIENVEKNELTKKFKGKFKSTFGLGATQMMKKMNPYYQTIQDPFHFTGVKIPDLDIADSEPFHCRFKFNITTNTNGEAVAIAGNYGFASSIKPSLIPKQYSPSNTYYVINTNNDASMTISNLLAGTNIPAAYPQWNSTTPTVQSKYTHVRVVSAGLSAQALGATNLSQGKLSGAFFPKDKLAKVVGVGNLTLVQIENQQDSIIIPLNEFKPFVLRYKPVDKSLLEYWPLDQSPVIAKDLGEDGAEPGTFVVAVTGAAANVSIQLILHVNYEGLVKDVTLSSGGSKTAYVDSNALDHAFQEISTLPAATSAKTVQFEQSKSGPIANGPVQNAVKPSKPLLQSMIDMVPTIMEKGTGVIDKVAPLLALI